jgi:hypothetical protein
LINRSSRLFERWGHFYNFFSGGLKKLVLPNKTDAYRILRGPGRGIRFLTNPAGGGMRILLGLYEPCLMDWFRRVIRPGSVIYDIGTADGHEALIAAHLTGPHGRVVAFEHNAQTRKQLEANLALNPTLAGRITIQPFFVGSLHDPDRHKISIDELLRQSNGIIPPPDIVKIDVDGPELDVLAGMEQLALRKCPQLFVECHYTPQVEKDVISFLRRHGKSVRRSSASLFEVSRQCYNTWVWTI